MQSDVQLSGVTAPSDKAEKKTKIITNNNKGEHTVVVLRGGECDPLHNTTGHMFLDYCLLKFLKSPKLTSQHSEAI